jgi:hypothetical protein
MPGPDRARKIAILVVAIAVGIAAFVAMTALFDTR